MIKKIFLVFFLLIVGLNFIYASVTDNVAEELNLKSVLDSLDKYSNIDIYATAQDLIDGNGIDYGVIGKLLTNTLFKEISMVIKHVISILIVIVLIAIANSFQLENNSSTIKLVELIGFVVIVTMLLKDYTLILQTFTKSVDKITAIVEIISPFMLAILIATGKIATSGIISSIVLFVTSLIGIIVNYVVISLLTLSIVFKIITNLSETIKLEKLGNLCKTTSIWIISIIFAVFLAVLELETSITTSVDGITVKVAQTAVSNVIPVVGKFVSDSMEVVMNSTQLVGKSVGVIGIVIMVVTVAIPLIKLTIYTTVYSLLEAFSEALLVSSKTSNIIGAFKEQYKVILGILFGIMTTFIIAIGIVISILGKVSGN